MDNKQQKHNPMQDSIKEAHTRITPFLHKTPILFSDTLNNMLDNNVYFKMDAMQKTGAFKIRGVLNHLLFLQQQNNLPKKIVAYSTGNHALAVGYAAKLFNIKSRVYLPANVSPIKKKISKYYGSEVIEVATRIEAEKSSLHDGENGFYNIHPSDNDLTIYGAGTMAYEAFNQLKESNMPLPDYVYGSCGGGGLLSGTIIARDLIAHKTKIVGAEPENANDAYQSLQKDQIYRFSDSPDTLADGLRALSISDRTFKYIKRLDEFILVDEHQIHYWTAWLFQLLKVTCEPSSAVAMAAAFKMIREKKMKNKNLLILISGGNIDPTFYKTLLNEEYYLSPPRV